MSQQGAGLVCLEWGVLEGLSERDVRAEGAGRGGAPPHCATRSCRLMRADLCTMETSSDRGGRACSDTRTRIASGWNQNIKCLAGMYITRHEHAVSGIIS